MLHVTGAALWLALATVVPGAAALAAVGCRSRGAVRLCLAAGTSISLWPCLLLWSTTLGVPWTPVLLRLLLVGALVATALSAGRGLLERLRPQGGLGPPALGTVTFLFVAAVALVARAVQARTLAVPAWVDGLHHTVVTQIVLDTGAVPAGLRPYAPVDGFYYHFGFHALAAAAAFCGGLPAARAVLWTGQALGAVAVLGAFLLARWAVDRPLAAAAAAAVPATLFTFPGYFVSWSRYTELAGLAALPAAWVLLDEAGRPNSPRRWAVLAGLVAGGLVLVHYQIAVYFAIGVLLMSARRIAYPGGAGAYLGRLALVALVALAAVWPWLLGPLASGVATMAASSPRWPVAPPGVDDVPAWLFTDHGAMAWLFLAAAGVAVGLARRRTMAVGLIGFLGAASVAVKPNLLGLPATWVLPPFSLAIALFLPVTVGVALFLDGALAVPWVWLPEKRRRQALALATAVAVCLGLYTSRDILNPDTVLAGAADVAAGQWIERSTPPDARFLVSTALWHVQTYRGLDGGYWLPILAHRQASIPPALYPYGDPATVTEISRTAEAASRGTALGPSGLDTLMDRLSACYVYVGPASAGNGGALDPSWLRQVPGLVEVYNRDGVHVFRRARCGDPRWDVPE